MTSDQTAALTAAAHTYLDADTADRWLSLLSPSLRLVHAPAGSTVPSVGWLGGNPLMPANEPWPTWEGHGELSHVMTVDCAALAEAVPQSLRDAGFPAHGYLSFFYFDGQLDDWEAVPGIGFDGHDGAALRYWADPATLTERNTPEVLDIYERVPLVADVVTTWPSYEHPAFDRSTEGWDELYEAVEAFETGTRLHQLGGHAAPVQGPVEYEIAYGVLRQQRGEIGWADHAVTAEAANWMLLAQIDSDSTPDFCWGDAGMLYFLIRSADLAAGNFDAAEVTMQCS